MFVVLVRVLVLGHYKVRSDVLKNKFNKIEELGMKHLSVNYKLNVVFMHLLR